MLYANKANDIISSITQEESNRYIEYWKGLKPATPAEQYLRWIFSFLSVHTTWRANVRGYNLLKDRTWETDREELDRRIRASGVGLQKNRVEGIWRFKERFWNDPTWWTKTTDETWVQARNRMEEQCFGLGLAKTSFALEMCFPAECDVVCLDTHMLRIYGISGSAPTPRKYHMHESHWVAKCKELSVPPVIAKNVHWDRVQKQPTPEYWAYVFRYENPRNDGEELLQSGEGRLSSVPGSLTPALHAAERNDVLLQTLRSTMAVEIPAITSPVELDGVDVLSEAQPSANTASPPVVTPIEITYEKSSENISGPVEIQS